MDPTLSESIDNALQLVGIPKIIGPIVEARERGKKNEIVVFILILSCFQRLKHLFSHNIILR